MRHVVGKTVMGGGEEDVWRSLGFKVGVRGFNAEGFGVSDPGC